MTSTVPLVLLPRYSTLAGASTFSTTAVRVDDYDEAQVFVWRGLLAATCTFRITLQDSMDQQLWTDLFMGDPGAETEATYTVPLTRLWFRAQVVLGGTPPAFPSVSCYALGFLVSRRK